MQSSRQIEINQAQRINRLHQQADAAALRCAELAAFGLFEEAAAAYRKSLYLDRIASQASYRLDRMKFSNDKVEREE